MSTGGYLVREPMRLIEAEAWVIAKLGQTPRAEHSRFVGYSMRAMADLLAPDDAELWEITGLLHDLDFFVVAGDWHIHGRTTAAWLEGRLPLPVLLAIASHDHRSGIISDAPLSWALRLTNALAVLDEQAGRQAMLAALRDGEAAIAVLAGERAYLSQMIVGLTGSLGLDFATLAAAFGRLPIQCAG